MFTGIVQGTAKLVSIDEKPNFRTHVVELPEYMLENNRQIWFKVQDPTLMKYILYKGFIGIDGISLTVGEVTATRFCVHLIPETLERTTLGKKKLGARVNIEIDPQTQAVVDTVERVLAAREAAVTKTASEA